MNKTKKILNTTVEILLYSVMTAQMLYAFFGNIPHEILGMVFFALLACHVVLKRWWFRSLFRKVRNKPPLRIAADLIILLLMLTDVVLALSAMGVSRVLFPKVTFLRNPDLHRYLATAVLALAVLHGGSVMLIRSKNKKLTVALTLVFMAGTLALGLALVPYLDRHFKKVSIDYETAVSGPRLSYGEFSGVAAVCFTRVGNTDFEENVDAVSGASLMMASGKLTGNAELLADMIHDISGCPVEMIRLTGEKYPSSYADTVTVGGRELREKARPAIEPIDLSGYDTVILVYPLWWGTIPMPAASFLENTDLSGKTVYLVATQGSAGFGSSRADAAKLAKGAEVVEGLSIYCDDVPEARTVLCEWLDGLGKHLDKEKNGQ